MGIGPSNCDDKDKYGKTDIAERFILSEISLTFECCPFKGMKIAFSFILNLSIFSSFKKPTTLPGPDLTIPNNSSKLLTH